MKTKNIALALALLALPAVVQAQDFTYTTDNSTITITAYTGPGGDVTIPDTISGLPVTSIGYAAFGECTSLAAITVDTNNPAYSSVAGVMFNKSQTTLTEYPGGQSRKLHDSQQRHQHRELCIHVLHQPDQRHDSQQRHQHRELYVLSMHQPDQR